MPLLKPTTLVSSVVSGSTLVSSVVDVVEALFNFIPNLSKTQKDLSV
jgi:hypothetical protein